MKVYILTGMPGSGKEELVQVARELSFDIVRMGDVVRLEASKRGISDSDRSIGGFAHAERQAHGYGIWAERTLQHLGERDSIIDGCRGWAEVEVFKRALGQNAKIIAIHSSPSTRFQRLQRRNRSDAPRTWEEFLERDNRELGWGLGSLIALADVMIVNEKPLEQFKKEAYDLLTRLD